MVYSIQVSTERDIQAIQAIYSHYVSHTVSTFEETPPDAEEMYKRWEKVIQAGLPYLIAKGKDGDVKGFAYATHYRPRTAYRFTVEDSIYISPDNVGQGIGAALLSEVIVQVCALGYKQLLAVVAGGRENQSSIALHKKFGFEEVGILKEVGFKFNCPVDTLLMQRALKV